MSRIVITMSRTIFIRLLAHAPGRTAAGGERGRPESHPRVLLNGRRYPGKVAQEEQWDELSADVQQEAVQSLLDAGEYCDLKHKVAASAGYVSKTPRQVYASNQFRLAGHQVGRCSSSLIFTRISLRVPGKPEGRLARGRWCCGRHSPLRCG